MSIQIKRINERYSAVVTPPHGGGQLWKSQSGMALRDLIRKLEELGCHQTDIGDALFDADPLWQERLQAGRRGLSLDRVSEIAEPEEPLERPED